MVERVKCRLCGALDPDFCWDASHRSVLVICLGLYVAGVLIGFDNYSSVCISATHIVQQWQGASRAPL